MFPRKVFNQAPAFSSAGVSVAFVSSDETVSTTRSNADIKGVPDVIFEAERCTFPTISCRSWRVMPGDQSLMRVASERGRRAPDVSTTAAVTPISVAMAIDEIGYARIVPRVASRPNSAVSFAATALAATTSFTSDTRDARSLLSSASVASGSSRSLITERFEIHGSIYRT